MSDSDALRAMSEEFGIPAVTSEVFAQMNMGPGQVVLLADRTPKEIRGIFEMIRDARST